MDCRDAKENLSAYLDGELEPAVEKALGTHLEGCEDCRAELESLRSTAALVKSLPRIKAPAILKERVLAAAKPRRASYRFPNALALLTAAALVLVAVVAVFMLSTPEPPLTSETAVAPKPEADAGLAREKYVGKEVLGKAGEVDGVAEKQAAEIEEADFNKNGFKNSGAKHEEIKKLAKGITGAEEDVPAKTGEGGYFGETQDEAAGQELTQNERMQRRLKKFTEKLAEEKELDGSVEKLAELNKKAAPSTQAGRNAMRESMAKKPAASAGSEPAAPAPPSAVKAKQKLADRDAGSQIEELELKARNVTLTVKAVKELLAEYEEKSHKENAGRPKDPAARLEKSEETDDESVVLVVSVDSREYEELVRKLHALDLSGPLTEPEEARNEKKEESADKELSRKGRGGGGVFGKKPEKPEAESAEGAAKAPGAPSPAKPAAPSGGRGRAKAKDQTDKSYEGVPKKRALRGAEKALPRQERKWKEPQPEKPKADKEAETDEKKPATGKAKKEEAGKTGEQTAGKSSPPEEEEREKADSEDAGVKLITLHIRIIKNGMSAADLLKLNREKALKDAAKEPAASPGK